MNKNTSLYEYVSLDLFSEIEGITSRRMFGGYGFYYYGKFFAIISDGKLFFKVGEGNREDYERYFSTPFIYTSRGKEVELPFCELPPDIMEEKNGLLEWIEKAASQKTKSSKKHRT
ncbi:MAG: TfoX/Sxy family protein [Candidatus Levyibacteriota bacterium]